MYMHYCSRFDFYAMIVCGENEWNRSRIRVCLEFFYSVTVCSFEQVYNYLLIICRSVDCFRLGWPLRTDADFFCQPVDPEKGTDNIVSFYRRILIISLHA